MEASGEQKLVVIQRADAVFWMDGRGRWHNCHGPFSHRKIIEHFNASIQKDQEGYFLTQNLGSVIEKVYFPYEETALFVTDIFWKDEDPVRIRLNTGTELALEPETLFVDGEDLYVRIGEEIAKFREHALLAISNRITWEEGRYCIMIGRESIPLVEGNSTP